MTDTGDHQTDMLNARETEIESLRKRLEPAERLGWLVHRIFPIPATMHRVGDERYFIEHELTKDQVQEFLEALHVFSGGCGCERCDADRSMEDPR